MYHNRSRVVRISVTSPPGIVGVRMALRSVNNHRWLWGKAGLRRDGTLTLGELGDSGHGQSVKMEFREGEEGVGVWHWAVNSSIQLGTAIS